MFGLVRNILSVFSRKPKNLDAITAAYVKGMTTKPSAEFIKVIDNYMVKNSKVVNGTKYTMKQLIAKADVIYLGNINDSDDSFRNLVKNAHHGTKQGSGLVWDAYWGYSNPSGTGYVDTNYNPSTQGVNYTLNDAAIAINAYSPQINYVAYLISIFTASSLYSNIRFGSTQGAKVGSINKAEANVQTGVPFISGLHLASRLSTTTKFVNQNLINSTYTSTANVIGTQTILFGSIPSSITYTGNLNFTYIGASLTDDEFTALNLIVNEYLIQCLYLKYGASNWGVQMAKSYFDTLHNFEPYEAWEVYEFIKRHQSDYVDSAATGYLYNTFGPSGQNKDVADYIMLFKAGGNLAANAWTKTGDTLRWNQDGAITSSNTMPAYTRGTNLGIVTVTSTDGWNGVSGFYIYQTRNSVNSFYGNFPKINRIRGNSPLSFLIIQNRYNIDLTEDYPYLSVLRVYRIEGMGSIKIDINKIQYNSMTELQLHTLTNFDVTFNVTLSQVLGNATNIILTTNKIAGSLENVMLTDLHTSLIINNTFIINGLNTWNKNLNTFDLSNNTFSTAAVDSQLSVINTYFATNTPIKNLIVNLSGATMGIPTDGANNTDLLGIVAKHTAAGFTATITVRTS